MEKAGFCEAVPGKRMEERKWHTHGKAWEGCRGRK